MHCCADCRAFTESMPHLFDEATLIEKQRAAETAKRAEEAAAKEAADAAAAEAAAAQAEVEETGRKARRAARHSCSSFVSTGLVRCCYSCQCRYGKVGCQAVLPGNSDARSLPNGGWRRAAGCHGHTPAHVMSRCGCMTASWMRRRGRVFTDASHDVGGLTLSLLGWPQTRRKRSAAAAALTPANILTTSTRRRKSSAAAAAALAAEAALEAALDEDDGDGDGDGSAHGGSSGSKRSSRRQRSAEEDDYTEEDAA